MHTLVAPLRVILLGESVVAVMKGMESQEDWTPAAATSAFVGMGISFLIWWWYFDGASGASEQPVRTKRDALRFHVWSYAHLPLYLGIVVLGVGIQRIVTAASRATLTTTEGAILTGAATIVMFAITIIGATSASRRRCNSLTISGNVALALGMLVIGWVARGLGSPVVMVIVIAGLCIAQLSVALSGVSSPGPIAEGAGARHQVTL